MGREVPVKVREVPVKVREVPVKQREVPVKDLRSGSSHEKDCRQGVYLRQCS